MGVNPVEVRVLLAALRFFWGSPAARSYSSPRYALAGSLPQILHGIESRQLTEWSKNRVAAAFSTVAGSPPKYPSFMSYRRPIQHLSSALPVRHTVTHQR